MTGSYRSNRTALLLLLPWLLVFSVFWAYPALNSLWLSFREESLFRPGAGTFTGIQNYRNLVQDQRFLKALGNTTIFVLGTIPATTAGALALAMLIMNAGIMRPILRPAVFVPSLLSLVVIAVVFKYLYSYPLGPVNRLLTLFDISALPFLTSPDTALLSVMLMNVWAATGYYSLLYLSALLSIPPELYEAASVDGAGPWRSFFSITLPMLKPMTLFIIVINTIRSFQVFPEVFTLTGGGPAGSTTTVVFNIYEEAFKRFNIGYASSQAYFLVAVTVGISLIQMRLLRQKDNGKT